MKLGTITELYQLISQGTENFAERKQAIRLRRAGLADCISGQGFNKVAFDTRRVNQEEDYIPRRGLQNYHRSEKFISDGIASKVKSFTRLSGLLDLLKLEFGKQPEWQDSYTRVLASAVHKGLRTSEADGDFSDAQPSMASLDYLEELMYVRYRMTPDNMMSMSDDDLRDAILKKDELLISRIGFVPEPVITPSDVSKYSYEQMMDKMLNTISQVMQHKLETSGSPAPTVNVKPAGDNDRTITITIKG